VDDRLTYPLLLSESGDWNKERSMCRIVAEYSATTYVRIDNVVSFAVRFSRWENGKLSSGIEVDGLGLGTDLA
jgi:hypothetical protein